jgi:hypothetical protein
MPSKHIKASDKTVETDKTDKTDKNKQGIQK